MIDIVKALEKLIERINMDQGPNGGLVSSETIRACDEARVTLSRFKASPEGSGALQGDQPSSRGLL